MFDTYTKDGINQIYFCLQDGFENVPIQVGDKAPLDEYGLSMLSIIVDENGELAYCTTRWNHKNGGSDSAMSAKEVSQVVGVHFYNTFKPNNKWANIIETAKQRLANGESPKDVFDDVGNFDEGFACVQLNGKWNLINQEAQLISNQWFDYIGDFYEGFKLVKLNGKFYRLDTSGRLYNINENKEYKISKNMSKNKNMKNKLIRLTEGDLHRIIKESVNKVLKESAWNSIDDEYDEYGDYRYVGRIASYYDDEDNMYDDWTWTYSDDINDDDFVGEVYELTPEDSRELDYWLRCRRMNDYQRQHSFNPRTQGTEEMYVYLIKNAKRVK